MAGTVVAVFENPRQAEQAAQALLDDGVPLADITLVRKDAGGETGAPDIEGNEPAEREEEYLSHAVREVAMHDVEEPMNTVDSVWPRVVVGIVIGSSACALIVSTMIYIPGVETLLTRYPLGVELGAMVFGGVLGAIAGAVTADGIPAEAANAYRAHVERGDTLVAVLSSSSHAPHLQQTLREHGGQRLGFFRRFIDTIQSVES